MRRLFGGFVARDTVGRIAAIGGVVGASACGPTREPTVEVGEICGHEGPFRLLELPDDHAPVSTWPGVQQLGDRLVAITAPVDGDGAPGPGTAWAFGPCGEDVVMLGEGIAAVFERAAVSGTLLGMTGASERDAVVLDPSGGAPTPFLSDVSTTDPWTTHGVVTTVPSDPAATSVALWLRPYPAEVGAMPPPSVLLVEDAKARAFRVVGDDLFVLRESGALERHGLADGVVEPIATGVEQMAVSPDGRWVAHAGGAQAVLVDREAATSTTYDGVAERALRFEGDRLVLQLAGDSLFEQIVALPSLAVHDIPPEIVLSRRIEGERWIAYPRDDQFGDTLLYDAGSGAVVTLFDEPWTVGLAKPDGIEALALADDARTDRLRDEATLWWIPYDGDAVALANAATAYWIRLGDGRVVSTIDVDARARGDLVVAGADDTEGDVFEHGAFSWASRFHFGDLHEEDAVVYAIGDGERSGIWVARPLPRD